MPGEKHYIGCLQKLAAMTDLIRAAMEAEEWEQLVAHLEARQALMGQIDQIPSEGRRLSPEERAVAISLLEQIAAGDREIVSHLESARDDNRTEVEEHRLARTTMSAYRKTSRPLDHELRARFLDKQQ